MPKLSEFYGIIITMNFGDHHPPHFHAQYGEHEATFGIDPVDIQRGSLPNRARRLVLEWAAAHRVELSENWERASRFESVNRIAPLD